MRLQLNFLPAANTLEIHSPGQPARSLQPEELESLAHEPHPENAAAMIDLGTRLYRLLDGPERRLATLAPNSTLDLHFVTEPGHPAPLAHFPWEVLHDETGFLIQRGILPVRQISFGAQMRPTSDAALANRPLNVLFMACSPRNVTPLLNFEAEERIILDATSRQPLYLTPEETGSVEELHETVRSYDPFDVFHLTGHGDLYHEARHKGYLASNQRFPNGRPVLLTEDKRGDCYLADAEMIERAFENRVPSLVFLSGCRTGEQPREEQSKASLAHASLAQDLLYRGFPSVLGWARPVLDTSATAAAVLLYEELAAGSPIEGSMRHALREMSRPGSNGEPFQFPDWHLLRLFTTNGCATAALVTPKNSRGRKPFAAPRFDEGFLDPANRKLKVAGFRRFVGRRRSLQRTLPALEPGSASTGVVIWGMGGLGKSSLAARLCDRVERRNRQFRRAVLVGQLNEDRLLPLLRAKYADRESASVLDSQLPLSGKLQNFFASIDEEHPLLLVLDDFEKNITLDANSREGFRLSRPAFDTLAALGTAVRESQSQSRLIVTARYWSAGSFPEIDLTAEQLPQMDPAELAKKARKELPGFEPEAIQKLIGSAAGNPRLFESLSKENRADAEEVFRKELQLENVVETLSQEERSQLARLSVFQLPVSPSMAIDVAGDADFHRAVSLGLVERTEPPTGEADQQMAAAALVRPLLESTLDDKEWRSAYSNAARTAWQSWWVEQEARSELRGVEVIRLATLGGEREIACEIAERLAIYWNDRARYRDTVRWARFVLSRFEDHRLLSSVAVAERKLGDTASAIAHLDRARALVPFEDAFERAFALHETATLRAQQGDVAGAMDLYRQTLEIKEQIGDVRGKAATLHEMAVLQAQQGDVAGAMDLNRQSLEIEEQIGDVKGKAATLHQMAILQAQQGDAAGAMDLYRQSLEIEEQIGNVQGKAATLHHMAILRAHQGDVAGAINLYRQSLEIKEQIGDVRGKAATLHQMAGIQAQQGDAAGAMDLYRQSLEIEEQIGDVLGKAATLASMAGLAHAAKDAGSATDYSKQAAQALAAARAWPDLSIVLSNLSVFDSERRVFWAAQSAWLLLVLRGVNPRSLRVVANLFHALPSAHPLELPLAAISMFFAGDGAEKEKNQEESAKLLSIAAQNQGMSDEAAIRWLQEKLKDPTTLIQETLRSLEALDPEPWIFDRQAVIASVTADMRSSKQVNA